MRTRLNGFTIREERPRARVAKRFIEMDLPTLASATTRASTSRLWLFSALATADASTLRTSSAIANAENNHNLDVDALVVTEASVGKSITMKRFHTRGRGKSTRILKPFSRLRIVVREVQEEA